MYPSSIGLTVSKNAADFLRVVLIPTTEQYKLLYTKHENLKLYTVSPINGDECWIFGKHTCKIMDILDNIINMLDPKEYKFIRTIDGEVFCHLGEYHNHMSSMRVISTVAISYNKESTTLVNLPEK